MTGWKVVCVCFVFESFVLQYSGEVFTWSISLDLREISIEARAEKANIFSFILGGKKESLFKFYLMMVSFQVEQLIRTD